MDCIHSTQVKLSLITGNPSTVVHWLRLENLFCAVAPDVIFGNINTEQSVGKVIFLAELKEGSKCVVVVSSIWRCNVSSVNTHVGHFLNEHPDEIQSDIVHGSES